MDPMVAASQLFGASLQNLLCELIRLIVLLTGMSTRSQNTRRWDRALKAWFLAREITVCEVCGNTQTLTIAHALKRRFIRTVEDYNRAALLCQSCHHFVDYGSSEVPGGHERMARLIDEIIARRGVRAVMDHYSSDGVLREEEGGGVPRSPGGRLRAQMEEMLSRQLELSALPPPVPPVSVAVGNIPDDTLLSHLRESYSRWAQPIVEDPDVPPYQMYLGSYDTDSEGALTPEMMEEMRERTRVSMSPAQLATYQELFQGRPDHQDSYQSELARSYRSIRDMLRPSMIIADDIDDRPTQAESVFDGLMEGIKIETEEPKKPSRKMRLIKD